MIPPLSPQRFLLLPLILATTFGSVLPSLGAITLFEENFESYTSDTDLQNSWTTTALGSVGSPVATVENVIVLAGLQSMQLDYDMPITGVGDTVVYGFGTPQDFSQGTLVRFFYRGETGNSNDHLFFELLDGVGASLGNALITSGTLVNTWNEALVDLTGFAGDLTEVDSIVLGVVDNPVAALGGTGTVYFDAVTVEGVPEPGIAHLLLVASSLTWLVRRRR